MVVMSFKIGFLLLIPADLALICWLKVETFLNDLTHGKPSSRVVLAYPQLFCISAFTHLVFGEFANLAKIVEILTIVSNDYWFIIFTKLPSRIVSSFIVEKHYVRVKAREPSLLAK